MEGSMKLSVCGLGSALAALFGLVALLCGAANLIFPGYGAGLLQLLDSIYPGYTYGKWGFGGVLIATGYAVIDGFVVGVVFAWLYNLCRCKKET